MSCKNCGKNILETGVSYGINPDSVCMCDVPAPKPNTTNSELDEILDYAEIFYNDSKWEEREKINPTYSELKARLEALIASKVEEAEKSLEYELNTEQCVKVATYMYKQWQEAMKPPLYIYRTFPDWLKDLQALEASRDE